MVEQIPCGHVEPSQVREGGGHVSVDPSFFILADRVVSILSRTGGPSEVPCLRGAHSGAASVHATICHTFVHMRVRVMLMIWEVLAAHFVNDAALLDLRSRGLITANVGSCCVIGLHRAMGERVNQRAARHPRRCFAIQPSAGYAACLDYHTGCRNFRAHELNTVKVDSLHDFSPPAVTESQRACYSIHLGDGVCPFIFHIAKVSRSPSRTHVRVTLVIRWLFAARVVDVAGFWNFQVHGLNTPKVAFPRDVSLCYAMRKRAKQCGIRPPHGPNTAKMKHTLRRSPLRRPCVLDSAVP